MAKADDQWRKRSEELVRSAKLSFSVHAESLRTSASPHTLTLRASADLNNEHQSWTVLTPAARVS